MARRPHYGLKFVGLPSWETELVDNIEKASEYGENWAHNKIVICFKARFALPPQDHPNYAVLIQRTFSAPLRPFIDDESQEFGIYSAFDLIQLMFESTLFPSFYNLIDEIIAGVKSFADTHRADLSAATSPVALRMNVNIFSLLHEIPDIYFEYEARESAHVTDIADLIGYDSRRPWVSVNRVLYYDIDRPYDERERIFQRNFLLDIESDDDDFDPSSLPIMFMAASEDSIESLEKVTIDKGSISMENCSICLEDISVGTEATRLPCSHHYHPDCIVKWLEISKFCPLCRFELS